MLYLLFSIIVLIPVFIGFGEIFQRTFGKFSFGISTKIVTGMLTVSVIWTVFSFFTPLNIAIELSTVSVGLLAFSLTELTISSGSSTAALKFLFGCPHSWQFSSLLLRLLFSTTSGITSRQ